VSALADDDEIAAELRADKRFREALFGASHPYAAGIPAEKLKNLHAALVQTFAKRHYVGAQGTLVLVGGTDLAEMEKAVRAQFGSLARGEANPVVTEAAAVRQRPSYAGVTKKDDRLVHVKIGYATGPGRDSRRAARLVLREMIERRVAVVRERLAASYGVVSRLVERSGPGSFEIEGQLDAARAGEALAALRAAIDGLRRRDGFLEDFARARRRALALALVASERSAELAKQIEDDVLAVGDPADPRALARAVAVLTPQDVTAVIDSELKATAEVIVGVGAPAGLAQMFATAKLGDVQIDKR